MGYTEVSCQICAVSFNIARLRTKFEPLEAGWGYSHGNYYAGDASSSLCTIYNEQSGCENDWDAEPDGLHFPGRGCTFTGGMNGWKIGPEEMNGMKFPRYILLKPTDRVIENEEQVDCERESSYFISSQTTEAPDDFKPGELAKVRFGIVHFYPQNYDVMTGYNDVDMQVGVPVHDACWKIFERVSMLRLGRVDLEGFMALWHRQACGKCGFQELEYDAMLLKCKDQWWKHLPGAEYFGANPVNIPGMMLHLYDFYMTQPAGDNFILEIPSDKENTTDKLSRLPAELKSMILIDLSSKDIASLRQASRSFRYLPKQLFYQLIRKELPWFWEFEELDKFMTKLRADECERFHIQESEVYPFNWYILYKQLCLGKNKLLGLRNRVRIWSRAEAIAERIQLLRNGVEKGGTLSLLPTDDEKERGAVRCSLYCLQCDPKFMPRRYGNGDGS